MQIKAAGAGQTALQAQVVCAARLWTGYGSRLRDAPVCLSGFYRRLKDGVNKAQAILKVLMRYFLAMTVQVISSCVDIDPAAVFSSSDG